MTTRRDAARQAASQAAANVWARAGRPEARMTSAEYTGLVEVLIHHITLRFEQARLDVTFGEVVYGVLEAYLPPLFLRHISPQAGGGPEDLLDALDDAVLDHGTVPWRPPCHNDRQFVESVLGHDDRSYFAALVEVRAEGSRLEHLVVTQYMDQRQLLGRPPSFAEVAQALAAYGVGPGAVEKLLFGFSNRLRAQGAPRSSPERQGGGSAAA